MSLDDNALETSDVELWARRLEALLETERAGGTHWTVTSIAAASRVSRATLHAILARGRKYLDHLPLLIGLIFVAVVHLVRDVLMPADHRAWVRFADVTLWVAEIGTLVTLVVTGAMETLTELAETLAVGVHRIRAAWTGTALPGPRPRRPPAKEG